MISKYALPISCLFVGIILGYFSNSALSDHSIIPITSPENGNKIVSLLNSAKQSIQIETYVFTSDDVFNALLSAKSRGVDVEVIIEPRVGNDDNSAMYSRLANAGIKVRYASTKFQLTHAKFIIIDGKILVVGSHNLTYAALNKNREASLEVTDRSAISFFSSLFSHDWLIAT